MLKTLSWIAASRWMARKPLGASATRVPLITCTIQLPSFCRRFFRKEKCSMLAMGRSPMTIMARRSRIGRTRSGMEAAEYWLSASVLMMTSAPSFRA